MSAPIGWVVSAADYRGRPKTPKVTRTWFAKREEAEAHKRHQRELNQQPEFLLCVSPAVLKRGKPKQIAKPVTHGPMDWGR